jgi:mRNA interferase MazF
VSDAPAAAIVRGGVYRVDLGPTVGHEMRKTRPCVVVQRDSANRTSPLVIVCPLTDAKGTAGNLLNVFVPAGTGGATKDCLVVCNAIRSVDKRRIVRFEGRLSPELMADVDRGLRAILDL